MKRFVLAAVLPLAMATPIGIALAGSAFTIFDAINQAVTTNPGVGEATANRRATEAELRQTQSTLLPQVRLEARAGRNKWDLQNTIVPPLGNDTWLTSRESSIVVRQLLFDGFTSINEIWRQAARVDAAAYRARERTELIALDAAEAYIDVTRYMRLITLADQNVAAHRALQANVDARFQGGRAGEGDQQQVLERVEAAIAAQAQFRQQYDEARGTFRKAIGIEPHNLRTPGRLGRLPMSKDHALAVALRGNPTIQAAQSDRDAAKHAFDATAGRFFPRFILKAGRCGDEIPQRHSVTGPTWLQTSSRVGIFFAADRTLGDALSNQSVGKSNRCAMRACSAGPLSRSTGPGPREPHRRSHSSAEARDCCGPPGHRRLSEGV